MRQGWRYLTAAAVAGLSCTFDGATVPNRLSVGGWTGLGARGCRR